MKAAWVIVLLAVAGVVLFWNQIQQGVFNLTGIVQYASNAGFTGADLVTAIAIAYAESAGNPNAQGDFGDPIPGQYNAFGLWQINTGENPGFAGENLFDPQTNANAAYSLYEAAGFSFKPWSTFNNGQFQAFIAQATTEATGATS